jgi:hypothetical protein
MIKSIKETKMALENEMEDLKTLRMEMKKHNKFSENDNFKLD